LQFEVTFLFIQLLRFYDHNLIFGATEVEVGTGVDRRHTFIFNILLTVYRDIPVQ